MLYHLPLSGPWDFILLVIPANSLRTPTDLFVPPLSLAGSRNSSMVWYHSMEET